jgi:hypothetical protein
MADEKSNQPQTWVIGRKKRDTIDKFTVGDFTCIRARCGGWIVYGIATNGDLLKPPIVAISTKRDLLEWLDENLIE